MGEKFYSLPLDVQLAILDQRDTLCVKLRATESERDEARQDMQRLYDRYLAAKLECREAKAQVARLQDERIDQAVSAILTTSNRNQRLEAVYQAAKAFFAPGERAACYRHDSPCQCSPQTIAACSERRLIRAIEEVE